jgi:hypothetical protein
MDAAIQSSLRAALEYRVLEVGADHTLREALDGIAHLCASPGAQDKPTARATVRRGEGWGARKTERAEEEERPIPGDPSAMKGVDWAPQKDKGRRWADLRDDEEESEGGE